ncbi:hypothetical protein EJ05DRAFT_397857 [Pseudovirgaria hyperparasitica]|uniref:Uncharacterized protein n=1 Tax=Pseudovirgaria hyperparasitica TaxID=470096 RepID=A0A6A6W684_9PEZI|nr:uncharacterized protein EJ05DRAFT_397857 [Pseudovirgaria hyperparasitica]KAF2757699.1 hypothetical protein EJ05DRAFT_397857 [Pseudovirgaria hyperparasitica]
MSSRRPPPTLPRLRTNLLPFVPDVPRCDSSTLPDIPGLPSIQEGSPLAPRRVSSLVFSKQVSPKKTIKKSTSLTSASLSPPKHARGSSTAKGSMLPKQSGHDVQAHASVERGNAVSKEVWVDAQYDLDTPLSQILTTTMLFPSLTASACSSVCSSSGSCSPLLGDECVRTQVDGQEGHLHDDSSDSMHSDDSADMPTIARGMAKKGQNPGQHDGGEISQALRDLKHVQLAMLRMLGARFADLAGEAGKDERRVDGMDGAVRDSMVRFCAERGVDLLGLSPSDRVDVYLACMAEKGMPLGYEP